MITQPSRPGPPLAPEITIREPEPSDVHAELLRAKVELMYAIARHRKAWRAMAEYKQNIEENSSRQFTDTDPMWKRKTGDVAWWAAEMTAQATAVSALTAMIDWP